MWPRATACSRCVPTVVGSGPRPSRLTAPSSSQQARTEPASSGAQPPASVGAHWMLREAGRPLRPTAPT
eukprot:5102171-Alexandrium_andersonii.AAC.1